MDIQKIHFATGQVLEERNLTAQEVAEAAALNAAEVPRQAVKDSDKQAHTAVKADPVIQYLVTHTPAECEAYVQANVSNLADAKNILGKLAMVLSVLARVTLR